MARARQRQTYRARSREIDEGIRDMDSQNGGT